MQAVHFIQDLAVVVLAAGVVGWICQRLGLSVVVGYLVAGMVVGPYTPPFALVGDIGRIETLAQVGLVFLMFSIGLRLSLRRLRRLGFALVVATLLEALLIYQLARLAGAALGWSQAEGVFLAGLLMVSSSAVISKVLQDRGARHDTAGQYAMGVTVLEDVVAVAMLTLLGSLAGFGRVGATQLGGTLGRLGAFIVLAGVAGLLVVPWLLRKLSTAAAEELQTLLTAGLLLLMALLAHRAGYSLALGAFLLGAIVAETPQRTQVERTFEGLRDLFSAVFFVAIGMQIEVGRLVASAGLIAGLAAFAIVARTAACALGLIAVATPPRDAIRVGLLVTPIGEFSFIIAQLGISLGVLPARFYPLAVGVSLLTTLAAPVLARHADGISGWIVARQPRAVTAWFAQYGELLAWIEARAGRNRLWQLSRKRLLQVAVELLLVTGLLVFSEQLFGLLRGSVARRGLGPVGLELAFSGVLVLVVLPPLVAIWRNCSALALLWAEGATAGQPRAGRLRPAIETGLKTMVGAGLLVWLAAVVPWSGAARWLLLVIAVLAAGALGLLWRRLIYWHSELEVGLHEVLAPAGDPGDPAAPWLRPPSDWRLDVAECVLPDLARCRGRKLTEVDLRARFGCSVVGIDRQGFLLANPAPETVLYPRDRVLLLGSDAQLAGARAELAAVAAGEPAGGLDDVRMEVVVVPADSPGAGATLAELAPTRHSGVQVAGIGRQGVRTLTPGSEERLRPGDELLVLGQAEQIARFRARLRAAPGSA